MNLKEYRGRYAEEALMAGEGADVGREVDGGTTAGRTDPGDPLSPKITCPGERNGPDGERRDANEVKKEI